MRRPRSRFGTSPDGTSLGPDDFATTATVSFTDRRAAGRQRPRVPGRRRARQGPQRRRARDDLRSCLKARRATPASAWCSAIRRAPGYEAFRANIAEYVSLLPPNSHGEANPADKDPVPPPFDNTYNSPEHDAFVLKVKYQRNDKFFTENMVDGADRARLNQAWNDLFGSWPYHDAYLGMLADHYNLKLKSRRIEDLDAAQIAALPAAVAAVRHVAARALRRGDAGPDARPAGSRHRCAHVRQPRLAPAADGRREGEPARVLPEVPHRHRISITTRRCAR